MQLTFGNLLGALLVILGSKLLPAHIDPLFLGMACALVICLIGRFFGKSRQITAE